MGLISKIRERFSNVRVGKRIEMISERGGGFYSYAGRLYQSDLIRAAVRPQAKAVGKLLAVHILKNENGVQRNPQPYMRFLLEEPNPYMSGQVMQEKVALQLALNNNAFVLILKDENNMPIELFPVPAMTAETVYIFNELHIRFFMKNGKSLTVPYTELIHLRNDYCEDDIFGTSPASAIADLMDVVAVSDQSVVKAIKNSSVIRWILKYANTLRGDDLKKNVKEFSENYLSVGSDSFGAAGVSGDVDVVRVEPKDYVPNASQIKNTAERVYAFFNTNEKIINSTFTEDEWNSYFEAVIEPIALQMQNEYTRKLFTRRERSCGNHIYFEAANLKCASLSTKLALREMVDRGALTPDEWRETFNYAPIEGGSKPVRRLDTAPVTEGGE